MRDEPLLSIRSVSKRYPAGRTGFLGFGPRRQVNALNAVSLDIREGEIVGLVGESGSGKSTLGRLIVGLEAPSEGQLAFGRTPDGATGAQMVFQNPAGSLNPRQKVADILAEPLKVHGYTGDIAARVRELMDQVGLSPHFAERRPHEMSGGQAQRVGIARALALDPKLIVCDEPVSALDVSIQAQVLNLFINIQKRTGCSYLFISHDLHVVGRLCDRVAIMYLGAIVEVGPTEAVFADPRHPYTRLLLDSSPQLVAQKRRARPIVGEIPSPLDPPDGCYFNPRCPRATEICRSRRPALSGDEATRRFACHHPLGLPQAEGSRHGAAG